ncbi:streptophobe family protein [Streptomyces sp. NRRL S-118]|uniref:streptophobe family protein n=1 Tax=Streptomyces sp. NRRL S-118 TaxID=1463881 RepID=UPI003B6320FB
MTSVSRQVPQVPHPGAAHSGARHAARAWGDALLTVVAGVAAMAVVAALGLWAAGAADLPGGAFPSIVAAVVVMAAGGSVELAGDAGALAGTEAELTAMPLSVTLAGALATGAVFLRPLRRHAVTSVGELLGRIARTTVLWLGALAAITALARHSFTIDASEIAGDIAGDILDFLGATPTLGFRADLGRTLLFGLLWVLGVLLVALLVSRTAALPARLLRYQEPVRPAAFAMLLLVLAYVVVGVLVGIVVAATRGHPADTFAVILLGLPNVVWMALGVGIGGAWDGTAEGPFALPMPRILDAVLRSSPEATVDLGSLAEQDPRAWWLVPVAAVLLLGAACVMAVRSPARTRWWQHAVHLGVAFALTMLVIIPLTHVSARYGLSMIIIGDVDAFSGVVVLRPHLWAMVGLALVWGLVAGFLGGLLTSRVRRRGPVQVTPGAPLQPPEHR